MLRSIGAIITGFAFIAVFSFGADAVLHSVGAEFFDERGQTSNPAILLLTLAYVGVFAITGCYIAARLAPRRPMKHALILGALGLFFNVVGTIALWDTAPAWYHIIALLLVMPYAYAGGRLRERQLGDSGLSGTPLFSR